MPSIKCQFCRKSVDVGPVLVNSVYTCSSCLSKNPLLEQVVLLAIGRITRDERDKKDNRDKRDSVILQEKVEKKDSYSYTN